MFLFSTLIYNAVSAPIGFLTDMNRGQYMDLQYCPFLARDIANFMGGPLRNRTVGWQIIWKVRSMNRFTNIPYK